MRTVEIYKAKGDEKTGFINPMDGLERVETITIERGENGGYVARHELTEKQKEANAEMLKHGVSEEDLIKGDPVRSEPGVYNSLFDMIKQVAAYNSGRNDNTKMVIREDEHGWLFPTVVSKDNWLFWKIYKGG